MKNYMYEISNVRLYIDPATTSYVIQIVAGVIIACGAAIGVFWNKIGRIFKKKKIENIEKMTVETDNGENKELKAEDLLNESEDKEK